MIFADDPEPDFDDEEPGFDDEEEPGFDDEEEPGFDDEEEPGSDEDPEQDDEFDSDMTIDDEEPDFDEGVPKRSALDLSLDSLNVGLQRPSVVRPTNVSPKPDVVDENDAPSPAGSISISVTSEPAVVMSTVGSSQATEAISRPTETYDNMV